MQGIPLHVPAGQRLIVHKDHGVVLGVRLVGSRVHPAGLLARLRAKPSNVVPIYHYQTVQYQAVFRIRSGIRSGKRIRFRIRIQAGQNEKNKGEIHNHEELSRGLEASTFSYEV